MCCALLDTSFPGVAAPRCLRHFWACMLLHADDEEEMQGFDAPETEGDAAMAEMTEAVDADLDQFLTVAEPGATEVGTSMSHLCSTISHGSALCSEDHTGNQHIWQHTAHGENKHLPRCLHPVIKGGYEQQS